MAEIERKYLLPVAPSNVDLGIGVLLRQGYVIAAPGELRVRQDNEKFTLTVKGDGSLSRDEWESEIPSWVSITKPIDVRMIENRK